MFGMLPIYYELYFDYKIHLIYEFYKVARTTTNNFQTYRTVRDSLTVKKGMNEGTCGVFYIFSQLFFSAGEHCEKGQKLSLNFST